MTADIRVRYGRGGGSSSGRRQVGAFVRQERGVYLRSPDAPEVRLRAHDGSAPSPYSLLPSPDGRWIATFEPDGLEVFSSEEREWRTIAGVQTYAGTWLPACRESVPEPGGATGEPHVSVWSLHSQLGRRVQLQGIAKQAREGPCIVLADGDLVYLPEWTSFELRELGDSLRVEGELQVWDLAGPGIGRPSRSWHSCEYALRGASRLD